MEQLKPCPNCSRREYTFAYPLYAAKKAAIINNLRKKGCDNIEHFSKLLGIYDLEYMLKHKSTPVLLCKHCERLVSLCPHCEEPMDLGKRAVNICTVMVCPKCKNSYTLSGLPEDYESLRTQLAIQELDNLVGMQSIKSQVKGLVHYINTETKRKAMGLPSTTLTLHMVFLGNPGTGKTSVARIIGEIYKAMGLLESGHLVEIDRKDLVGEYIGHTAVKTSKRIAQAMGGILFIDEAYSLAKGSENDFGQESIDTLIKAMEDYRDRFVVIAAGYPKEMNFFLECNPGLKSRFSNIIKFNDYNPDELLEIFKKMLCDYEYEISQEALQRVREVIRESYINRGRNFSNGRLVRNLFDRIIKKQSVRLSRLTVVEKSHLVSIILEDVLDLEQI